MRFINKYVIIGIFLIILGIFLTPIYIGVPIMMFGFLIGNFGVLLWIIRLFPGLEEKMKKLIDEIKDSYKPYFRKKVKN